MKAIILLVLSTFLAGTTYAGEFYVLDFEDEVMISGQGEDQIRLKQSLRRQHPGVNFRETDLMSVLVVAKTRGGKGRMSLSVGPQSSSVKVFAGKQGSFKSSNSRSFDRQLFLNPKSNSQGRWSLSLRGHFMVRQVVVEVAEQGLDLLTLDYFHQHLKGNQGGGNTLNIRRKARNEKGISPNEYELEAVTIVAKSRHGNGKARLLVGERRSQRVVLDGNPGDFHTDREWTYGRYEIENPSPSSKGRWQIELSGNIKIHEVILHLVRK